MADLRLQGLGKRFGSVQAVRELSLEVASGELIVRLGPGGAGKTTTLRLAAGLEVPDAGQVHIGGRDVTALQPALRDVTFVFQQYSLYPHLNVFDNPAFPLRSPMRRMPEDEIRRKVTEVATMLRIGDKLASPATKLSGGQMQCVAIGRALVREPAVTLMDQPLSSLDAKLRNDLLPRPATGRLLALPATAAVGVRPDGAQLVPMDPRQERGHAQARVRRIESLGDPRHVHVALEGPGKEIELVTLYSDPTGLTPGQAVSVQFTAPLFFDAAGQRIPAT